MLRRTVALLGVLGASSVSPVLAQSTTDESPPAVDEAVAAAAADGVDVPVIITFHDDPRAPVEEVATEAGVDDIALSFPTIEAIATVVDGEELAGLAGDPRVVAIEPDRPAVAALTTARAAIGVTAMVNEFGLTGDGDGNPSTYSNDDVVVAVIDTGINSAHLALDAGKVRTHQHFATNCSAPIGSDWDDSNNGHGTHVAGIVAGDGNVVTGVAPAAALLDLKVLCDNSGSQAAVNNALSWVLANRTVYGIDAVNLSLSLGCHSDGLDSTSRLANQVVAAGVVVAAAAGNAAGGCPGGGVPGTVTSPAAARFVVGVGAAADPNDASGQMQGWRVAEFSLRGPAPDGRIKPELVAPGVGITSAHGGLAGGTNTLSGTSMASPFVAAVAGLLAEIQDGLRPSGTACSACPSGVVDTSMANPAFDVLRRTATDWGAPGPDNDSGWGILDAYRAVNLAVGATGGSPPARPCTLAAGGALGGGVTETWTAIAQGGFPVTVTTLSPTAAPHRVDVGTKANAGVARTLSASTAAVAGQPVAVSVTATSASGFSYSVEVSGATTLVRGATGNVAASCAPLASGRYVAIGPARALDTRIQAAPVGSGAVRTISLQAAGVPSFATAAVLNVTLTDSTSAGFVTVFPAGSDRPPTSTVNLTTPGQTVANAALVGLGPNAGVSIFNFASPVHVIVDVQGYFVAGGGGAGFVPVAPARLLDTRQGAGALGPGEERRLAIAPGAVPPGTAAVVLNVTVDQPTASGFLSVYPGAFPDVSNINFVPGLTLPNLVTVPLASDGSVAILNRGGFSHVVADIMGYYLTGGGASFVPVRPSRLLDTRDGTGGWSTILGFAPLYLDVTDLAGLPASGMVAVAMNLTATEATIQTHITAWPSDVSQPASSNANVQPGATRANLVTVGTGAPGFVWLEAVGRAHAIVDVTGYFA